MGGGGGWVALKAKQGNQLILSVLLQNTVYFQPLMHVLRAVYLSHLETPASIFRRNGRDSDSNMPAIPNCDMTSFEIQARDMHLPNLNRSSCMRLYDMNKALK